VIRRKPSASHKLKNPVLDVKIPSSFVFRFGLIDTADRPQRECIGHARHDEGSVVQCVAIGAETDVVEHHRLDFDVVDIEHQWRA
jgi:hypothetical protein